MSMRESLWRRALVWPREVAATWKLAAILLGLALIYILLNAAKPLHIDDTEYYYVARQISQRPLDPYDFEVFWYDIPQKATSVLAPPVVPYWWALALRLFGDQP